MNRDGIRVAKNWDYETGWFAERDEIRKTEYNLEGNTYAIKKETRQEAEYTLSELLQQLREKEKESGIILEQLIKMMKESV